MIKPVIWALLACLHSAPVLAAVAFTNIDYYIYAGQPFTVTWTGNRAPVTLTLMNGPDENLQPVLTIISDYNGQEYTWTPPASLPADSYVLRLEDGGSTDYSARFRYPSPPLSSTLAVVTGIGPTTTASEPLTASTTTSPTSTIPSPTSSDPSSSGGGGEVLSTPAKAIIAALGGLLLIALIALIAYCVAYRRRKHRDQKREREGSFGGALAGHEGHELVPPLSAVGSGYYESRSPDTVVGSSHGGSHVGNVNFKVDGQGVYQQGRGYERGPAELGGRDMVELSAEGRYLK